MSRTLLTIPLLASLAACESNTGTDEFPASSDAEATHHCHEQGFARAEPYTDNTWVCVRSVRP